MLIVNLGKSCSRCRGSVITAQRRAFSNRNLSFILELVVRDAVGTTLDFKFRDSNVTLPDIMLGEPFGLNDGDMMRSPRSRSAGKWLVRIRTEGLPVT
jgi:hypothetical protein